MNAIISFDEISDFIEKEFKIRPVFNSISHKGFEIRYKPHSFMPTLCIRFHIDAICNNVIYMSYDCAAATSLLIAGAVTYIEDRVPDGIEITTADKNVIIHLERIEQIEKTLKYIKLNNVTFEDSSVNATLAIV